MIKIKRTLNDHIKEQNFSKYMFIDPEKIQRFSGNIFNRLLNHILPPTRKFLRESFNAIEDGRILGQISLIPDNFSNFRWQISSLKIKDNNYALAKPLIDFVVNKYGGSGVSCFLVYIQETFPEMISLFKNECNFRSCAKIDFFKITDLNSSEGSFSQENFKDMGQDDVLPLLEINTTNIFTNFRPSLTSDLNDFKEIFFKSTQNDFIKVFVVNGRAEGYFRIYSIDKKNFFADVITSKPYENCYGGILDYMRNILFLAPEFQSLTVLLKRYRDTAVALENALVEDGYKLSETTQILVKDYWKKASDMQCDDKLFVFFNDLSIQPARYNSFSVE